VARSEDNFKEALKGKKLPILTLDNKWHQLFTQHNQNKETSKLTEELNDLLAKQGGLNSEIKDIRRLKAKLMDEIVSGMDDTSLTEKDMEDHKRLINECNEKIEACQDELMDLPREIERINYQLMLYTMDVCYEIMEENTEEIAQIGEWISNIRVELKKNVIRKQEKEWMNQELYTYMHNIFGPDVIEIFDMKYDPAGNMLKKSTDNKPEEKEESDS
jgi:chromosome segregation ATPase